MLLSKIDARATKEKPVTRSMFLKFIQKIAKEMTFDEAIAEVIWQCRYHGIEYRRYGKYIKTQIALAQYEQALE